MRTIRTVLAATTAAGTTAAYLTWPAFGDTGGGAIAVVAVVWLLAELRGLRRARERARDGQALPADAPDGPGEWGPVADALD
ncbi:hypothetical protein [Streptomyces genisteinicus]|uniref:Uncharacterized protein n=1 Tax=Streptomyces genisteinicus TaxID=2768068 RepID=A0A7H0HV09_9ACTN|nr:hypothetical protein [Streptomyces genisteinicus]QNP64375.1 hypothetical protein IAG43_16640 [Streptomyces genisteinicus]